MLSIVFANSQGGKISYRFCPPAYCRGGSYSYAQGSFINSYEQTMSNCTEQCEMDVACNIATWCPLCRPSQCLLFTACNLWKRDAVSESEVTSSCEVPGTEGEIADFLSRNCQPFSQRAVSFVKG
eukprot:901715-Rhodomonas_salina.1